MSIEVPWGIMRIIFVNTVGILPILLKCEMEENLFGSISLRTRFLEFCLCHPEFQMAIRHLGLTLVPAPFFGSDLMEITTPSAHRNTLYLLRVDRNKTEVGQVSEVFHGTQVPSLRVLALIQVHASYPTYEELHGNIPETLIEEVSEVPSRILELFDIGDSVYNCRGVH